MRTPEAFDKEFLGWLNQQTSEHRPAFRRMEERDGGGVMLGCEGGKSRRSDS